MSTSCEKRHPRAMAPIKVPSLRWLVQRRTKTMSNLFIGGRNIKSCIVNLDKFNRIQASRESKGKLLGYDKTNRLKAYSRSHKQTQAKRRNCTQGRFLAERKSPRWFVVSDVYFSTFASQSNKPFFFSFFLSNCNNQIPVQIRSR